MTVSMRIVATIVVALSLAGCTAHKGVLSASPPNFVNNVEVTLTRPMGSPALAETIRSKTLIEASRYGMAGQPKTLHVSVFQIHKKNPTMSFLVGDSNFISANVSVVDGTTQTEEAKIQVKTIDDAMVNGLIGAARAANQSEAEVEEILTTKLASDVLEHIYGSKAAKIARENPPTLMPAPGVVPAPSEKQGTPVALVNGTRTTDKSSATMLSKKESKTP